MSQSFDWSRIFYTGLHYLHLTPDQIWALGVKEFHMALGLDLAHPSGLNRNGFLALLAAYPDKGEQNG